MKKTFLLIVCLIFSFGFTPKPLTWVAIGDSITYLNDHQNETGNRITKGYLTLVTDKFPNVQVTNKGFNGWTAVKIATDFDKLAIPKADVYSILLGTNDWWGGKALGTFEDYQNATGTGTVYGSFRVIINNLRRLNDQAKIILIAPMQRVDFVYINDFKNNAYGSYREKNGQQLEQFADAIVAIGKTENFRVVDLYHKKGMEHARLVKFKRLKGPQTGEYKNFKYPDYIDVPFDPATDEYPYPKKSINLTYDGLHPSDKGYRLISKELFLFFKEILKESKE